MRVLRIDRVPTDGLPAYYAAERLRGLVETDVELVLMTTNHIEVTVTVKRRPIPGSVETDYLRFDGMTEGMPDLGYLRISSFQETTVQEVREALAQFQSVATVKGVILDLRGNPGGSFKSPVPVAQIFLPGRSLLVMTKGTVRDFD